MKPGGDHPINPLVENRVRNGCGLSRSFNRPPLRERTSRLDLHIVVRLIAEYRLQRFGAGSIGGSVAEVQSKLAGLIDTVLAETPPCLLVHCELLGEQSAVSGVEIFSHHGNAGVT
jgi:hypothetical protein